MAAGHRHPVDAAGVRRAQEKALNEAEGREVGEVLTLLADPVRAGIVTSLLVVEELCVGDLALAVDATEDAVSYGLRRLRTAGLVQSRPEARMRFYRCTDGTAKEALAGTLVMARRLAELRSRRVRAGGK